MQSRKRTSTQERVVNHQNSKQGARDEQVQEIANELKSCRRVDIGQIKALNSIEEHHWSGIINDSFPEDETVQQWCLVLIKHLYKSASFKLKPNFGHRQLLIYKKRHLEDFASYLQGTDRICRRKYCPNSCNKENGISRSKRETAQQRKTFRWWQRGYVVCTEIISQAYLDGTDVH